MELQESEAEIFSDEDADMKKAPAVKKWMESLKEGSQLFGKRYDIVDVLEDSLKDAGFVDIARDVYEVSLSENFEILLRR